MFPDHVAPEILYKDLQEGVISLKDEEFQSLPNNVQHALEMVLQKNKKTDFYNQLVTLNDKILIYKDMFYSRKQAHEINYEMKIKRQAEMIEELGRRRSDSTKEDPYNDKRRGKKKSTWKFDDYDVLPTYCRKNRLQKPQGLTAMEMVDKFKKMKKYKDIKN